MSCSKHIVALMVACFVRVAGFIFGIFTWGWAVDAFVPAMVFECFYTFVLMFFIAIIASISELILGKALKLSNHVKLLVYLLITLGVATVYIKSLFLDRGIVMTSDVAIGTGILDVVLPGAAYFICLMVFETSKNEGYRNDSTATH